MARAQRSPTNHSPLKTKQSPRLHHFFFPTVNPSSSCTVICPHYNCIFAHLQIYEKKEFQKKGGKGLTLFVSLLEGILFSKLSTRCDLVKPDPSLGMGRGPFLPISPRAVQAAMARRGDVLSKNEPGSTGDKTEKKTLLLLGSETSRKGPKTVLETAKQSQSLHFLLTDNLLTFSR